MNRISIEHVKPKMLFHKTHILQYTLLLIILTRPSLNLTSNIKTYRTDYEYSAKTDAFYKLHIEEVPQRVAAIMCAMEGAALMPPWSAEDIVQAHGMLKKFPDIGNRVWIESDGKKHQSAEEQPIINLQQTYSEENLEDEFYICEILTLRGEILSTHCFWDHPFICKVDAKDAPYDDQCGVYGTRYNYFSSVGSCYKIPLIALTWDEAYAECRAEGAHLVILNSEAEQRAVWDAIRAAKTATVAKWVPGTLALPIFLAGIRYNKPTDGNSSVWRTIFNESLTDAGYDGWTEGITDIVQGFDYCGAVHLKDGKYSHVDCTQHRNQFICESEVRPLQRNNR